MPTQSHALPSPQHSTQHAALGNTQREQQYHRIQVQREQAQLQYRDALSPELPLVAATGRRESCASEQESNPASLPLAHWEGSGPRSGLPAQRRWASGPTVGQWPSPASRAVMLSTAVSPRGRATRSGMGRPTCFPSALTRPEVVISLLSPA